MIDGLLSFEFLKNSLFVQEGGGGGFEWVHKHLRYRKNFSICSLLMNRSVVDKHNGDPNPQVQHLQLKTRHLTKTLHKNLNGKYSNNKINQLSKPDTTSFLYLVAFTKSQDDFTVYACLFNMQECFLSDTLKKDSFLM